MTDVSIIIPCRNEAAYIGACLDSVIANDFPADRTEILVVDGMSADGTRDILADHARRYPRLRVLDNPAGITPAALNLGIRAATGGVILRVDAHARIEKDYVRRCLETLDRTGADNVGGIIITLPKTDAPMSRAIARALSHPFGVGRSYFRIRPTESRWVDTVFGGCYRRDVFDRIGLFNEKLRRGQDMEFNLRLKRAGGRTFLSADIVSYYYPPSNLRLFWRHTWNNGVWAILPFAHSADMPVSWRHLAPLGSVLVLAAAVALATATAWPAARWILSGVLGTYALANLAAAAQVAVRERETGCLWRMPIVFAMLHLAYGLGSLWGLVKTAALLSERPSRRRSGSPHSGTAAPDPP